VGEGVANVGDDVGVVGDDVGLAVGVASGAFVIALIPHAQAIFLFMHKPPCMWKGVRNTEKNLPVQLYFLTS
jgi:hypothetical protein